jgi:hypothetical protein
MMTRRRQGKGRANADVGRVPGTNFPGFMNSDETIAANPSERSRSRRSGPELVIPRTTQDQLQGDPIHKTSTRTPHRTKTPWMGTRASPSNNAANRGVRGSQQGELTQSQPRPKSNVITPGIAQKTLPCFDHSLDQPIPTPSRRSSRNENALTKTRGNPRNPTIPPPNHTMYPRPPWNPIEPSKPTDGRPFPTHHPIVIIPPAHHIPTPCRDP